MKVLEYPNKFLSTATSRVTEFNSQLSKELAEMETIMIESGGAGIAANQVGLGKSMFVMLTTGGKVLKLVNPEITWKSDRVGKVFKEGCLSSKGIYEYVNRHSAVIVKFQSEVGEWSTIYFTKPRDSVCVQHEVDHLDGIFWFDRMHKNRKKGSIKRFEAMKLRAANKGLKDDKE